MSVYQCEECGCAENTSLGWYWTRDMVTDPKYFGRKLCCVCGPTHFDDGEPVHKEMGKWHDVFPRTFYQKGTLRTDSVGNLVPKDKTKKLSDFLIKEE